MKLGDQVKSAIGSFDRTIQVLDSRIKRSEEKLKNMDLTVGETVGNSARRNSDRMVSESFQTILS